MKRVAAALTALLLVAGSAAAQTSVGGPGLGATAGGGGTTFIGGTITAPIIGTPLAADADECHPIYTAIGDLTSGLGMATTIGAARVCVGRGMNAPPSAHSYAVFDTSGSTQILFISGDGTSQARTRMHPQKFAFTTVAPTGQSINFELGGDSTTLTFLSFVNVADPTKTISMTQNSSAPSLTTTLASSTESISVVHDVDAGPARTTTTVTGGALISTSVQQSTRFTDTATNGSDTWTMDAHPGNNLVMRSLADGSGNSVSEVMSTGSSSTTHHEMLVLNLTNTSKTEVHPTGPSETTTGTQPTCDVTIRGRRWRTTGGAGVVDTYEVCLKDGDDIYAWRPLATPRAIPSSPSCTGLGTGSCAMDTGSTDSAGIFVLSPTGAPGSSGNATATFSSTLGANQPVCVATAQNGTGLWNARVAIRGRPALDTGTLAFAWDNNSVSLSAGEVYSISYVCFGK